MAREHVTLPVYMAYCAIAGALRPWNREGSRAIVTLEVQDDYYTPLYTQAARVFAAGIWRPNEWEDSHVFEWSAKSGRDEVQAEKSQRAIFLSPPEYRLTEENRLFSDAVIPMGPRTRRHAEAALRRAKLPVDESTIDLLMSEPWSRLSKAFQDRRGPLQALDRLRQTRGQNSKDADSETTESTGPTLAEMHGIGPALDWGNNLAKDLADYRAGVIGWKDVDGGVLISGPPGGGKTMFASALANTCQVPIVFGSVSRWQEAGALDEHLKAMRNSFAEAKARAPSILFIDEVDTIGNRMEADRNRGYMRGVIAGLLELLDGFERRAGVVVLGACNYPQLVDPAIRRPGRLDRHLEIAPPDAQSRLAILGFHAGLDLDGDQAEKFEFATDGFSGAEIERLVRDAKRVARRRSETLSADHIVEQLPSVTVLPEDLLHCIAVHEAGHALVGFEIGHGQIADIKISSFRMDGSSRPLGQVEIERAAPRRRTKTAYLDAIAVYLGGAAAEAEAFGSFADGSSGGSAADLNRASDLATAVEGGMGMGHTLIVEQIEQEQLARMRQYNHELRKHVHQLLENEFERARSIIRAQRPALNALSERLLEKRIVPGEEVVQILQRHRKATVSLAKPPLRMGA
ncbi:AAA family ATPase [Rhizobium leguminosarum]|uniref:AAA family ATPase n=2 Tax=Rhizobium leguminosarum TaxID=384 RepID=UPI003F9B84B2